MSAPVIEAYFLNYLAIFTAAYERLIERVERGETSVPDWHQFHDSIDGDATIVVVFAAIVLESYMLNYAARHLGTDEAEKKVDRMPLVKKWLQEPLRVTGSGIPADAEAIKLLEALVAARHSIVHLRSPNTTLAALRMGMSNSSYKRREILQAALDTPRCIASLGAALAAVDGNEAFAQLFMKYAEQPRYAVLDSHHNGA